MSTMRPRDAALLASVAALWGFNFVPIRWALDEVPPFALAAMRFLLAAVPMVFFVRRPAIPARIVIAYGLAIGVGQFGLLFLAIRLGMQAGLASLLIQVQVFFTIALAAASLGDRVTRAQVAGACLAAIGVAALVGEKVGSGARSSALGLLLLLAAALSWAAGNVLAKHAARAHDRDAFALVVWSSLAPPIPLAILSYATEGGLSPLAALAHASWVAWASIVFMAAAATLWGFAVWNRMLDRYSAGAVTPFALLVPVAGIASATLLLREPLSVVEVASALVILAGLAVALLWRPTTRAPTPARA
ncbi:MAG TPA: EamA family transporter [Candidatus Thermoplasmatota archaeon]|nr:EamA family transporter [Candidatus Thermoplasmatota archaeon]